MAAGDDKESIEAAPEGAHCAEHPERTALVTCPRCGNYCCIACWHGAVKRCHVCLLREPPTPTPWADDSKPLYARFFETIIDSVRPARSAPAFASGNWRRGISFALLTLIPTAMLSGIIPFTHTLRFGPTWTITTIGQTVPTSTEIAFDLAQAAGLGLLVGILKVGLLAAPYLSLTAAYGQASDAAPTRQVMLYRAWLVPLGGHLGGLLMLAAWAAPLDPSSTIGLIAQVGALVPLMIVLWSMTATARIAGVGPIASMIVVVIPFIVMFLAEPMIIELMRPILPNTEVLAVPAG